MQGIINLTFLGVINASDDTEQLLLTKPFPQPRIMPPYTPNISPMEPWSPVAETATDSCNHPFPKVHGKNALGAYRIYPFLYGNAGEPSLSLPHDFALQKLRILRYRLVRPDGDPQAASAALCRYPEPIFCNSVLLMMNPYEVVPYTQWILVFWLDDPVISFGLLLVR